MRTPTDIKRKIDTLHFEYLKKIYADRLTKENPQNCLYNKKVVLHGDSEVTTRVCTYFSSAEAFELCDQSSCSRSCNAFVNKYTKKELRDALEKDIEESPTKYPVLTALNWTLETDQSLVVQRGWRLRFKYWTLECYYRVKTALQRMF